jgi:hypothetical protein
MLAAPQCATRPAIRSRGLGVRPLVSPERAENARLPYAARQCAGHENRRQDEDQQCDDGGHRAAPAASGQRNRSATAGFSGRFLPGLIPTVKHHRVVVPAFLVLRRPPGSCSILRSVAIERDFDPLGRAPESVRELLQESALKIVFAALIGAFVGADQQQIPVSRCMSRVLSEIPRSPPRSNSFA